MLSLKGLFEKLRRAPVPLPPVRPRLAVLIDAENSAQAIVEPLLARVEALGEPVLRRAYGDWSSASMNGWAKTLCKNAVVPIQQFSPVVGKNAADIALIIDAMDLLHGGGIDGFVIASSDSDYSRLVTRLREAGKLVYGAGRALTPKALVHSCTEFFYVEDLARKPVEVVVQAAPAPAAEEKRDIAEAFALITQGYHRVAERDGWAKLSRIANAIHEMKPGFSPRHYGHRKLVSIVEAMRADFAIAMQPPHPGATPEVKLRRKAL
jgi:hypothetical protein